MRVFPSILIIYLPLLSFFAAPLSYSQNLSISGRVVEQNSQTLTGKLKGLANVNLLIDGKIAQTDDNGYELSHNVLAVGQLKYRLVGMVQSQR